MFIFKTAKVWRDLAGEPPATEEDAPSNASLLETSKNDPKNERDGTQSGAAPKSVRPEKGR